MVLQHNSRVVAPGAILVKIGTPLPEPLKLEDDSAATHWGYIANNLNGRQLGERLVTAGWKFFYMAGSNQDGGLGLSKAKDGRCRAEAYHRERRVAKMQLPRL